MSSVRLLDKTRKIGSFLHNNSGGKVVFDDICDVMTQILDANLLVISKKGKVLGMGKNKNVPLIRELLARDVGKVIDGELNDRLLSVLSTKENVNLKLLGFGKLGGETYQALICPVYIAGERYGTLFIYRNGDAFDIDDVILCEYGATVVGLEMLRAVDEEDAEHMRKEQSYQMAADALSNLEKMAMVHIMKELDGLEGVIVASKIADREGITRSVIVNALRKMESAGIIETHSMGMKGTSVRVLNEAIFEMMD